VQPAQQKEIARLLEMTRCFKAIVLAQRWPLLVGVVANLFFRAHVPHEADLELLQGHADVRANHVENRLDLVGQFGRHGRSFALPSRLACHRGHITRADGEDVK
jgi:hypothetical protein